MQVFGVKATTEMQVPSRAPLLLSEPSASRELGYLGGGPSMGVRPRAALGPSSKTAKTSSRAGLVRCRLTTQVC